MKFIITIFVFSDDDSPKLSNFEEIKENHPLTEGCSKTIDEENNTEMKGRQTENGTATQQSLQSQDCTVFENVSDVFENVSDEYCTPKSPKLLNNHAPNRRVFWMRCYDYLQKYYRSTSSICTRAVMFTERRHPFTSFT